MCQTHVGDVGDVGIRVRDYVDDDVPHVSRNLQLIFEDLKRCQTRVGDVGDVGIRVRNYVDDNVPHACRNLQTWFEDLKQCKTRVGDVGVRALSGGGQGHGEAP